MQLRYQIITDENIFRQTNERRYVVGSVPCDLFGRRKRTSSEIFPFIKLLEESARKKPTRVGGRQPDGDEALSPLADVICIRIQNSICSSWSFARPVRVTCAAAELAVLISQQKRQVERHYCSLVVVGAASFNGTQI